jgi:hypothetical protein
MGQWVFLAGDEQSSYNDRSRLYLYDTDSSVARTGDTQLPEASGVVSLTLIGEYVYFSPWPHTLNGTMNYAAARSLLADADAVITEYVPYSTTGGGYYELGRPVLFNGFTLFPYVVYSSYYSNPVVDGGLVVKTNGESVSTVFSIGAQLILVGTTGKLFSFTAGSGGNIAMRSSTNGVSFSASTVIGPSTPSFAISGGLTLFADIYPSGYGAVIGVDRSAVKTGTFTANGGTTWTDATNLPTGVTGVYAYSSGVYATAGSHLYKTTNGTTWTDLGEPLGGEVLNDIAFGNSQYMLVGDNGGAATTTDFSTFTPFSGVNFNYHHIYAATYTASTVAVTPGNSGTLQLTSRPDTVIIQGSFSAATGSISGTLRLDTSTGVFAARTVYLYSYTTGAKIAETTSNGTTGVWEFTAVAPGEYFVVGVAMGSDLTIPRDFDAMGVITVT